MSFDIKLMILWVRNIDVRTAPFYLFFSQDYIEFDSKRADFAYKLIFKTKLHLFYNLFNIYLDFSDVAFNIMC